MTPTFRSSRAPECVLPRAHRDASQRLQNYGPVQSMDEPATAWDLLKFGMPGGLGMALLFVVATVAIIAFTAASDVTPPTSQHSTSAPIEARAGGKVSN